MLAAFLRSLAVTLLVALTSLGVVSSPVAHAVSPFDAAPEGGVRLVAKTAAQVGTKAAPLRLITCGSVPGLIACSAAAAGMWWLTETDSGRNFRDNAWEGTLELLGIRTRAEETWCGADITPEIWSQQGLVWGALPTYDNPRWSGYPSCASVISTGYAGSTIAYLDASCMTPAGELYSVRFDGKAGVSAGTAWTACAQGAGDWLVLLTISDASSTYAELTNPGVYRNPLWDGSSGIPSPEDVDIDGLLGGKTRVTLRCADASGTVTSHVHTVSGTGVDPAGLTCPSGTSLVGRTVDELRGSASGPVVTRIYETNVPQDARDAYPECFSGGASCDLGVTIDGVLCEPGRAGCVDWWDGAQQSPDRYRCLFGPYVLPYGDCRELQDAYVSPDGAWYPGDLAPGAAPIPYYPTNPEYRPEPPVGGATDPSWVNPDLCPPAPAGFFGAGVTEYGLQPIAVQALRCFAADHSDFKLSSAWRHQDHSASYSDHPHGLALDLAPPAWDTPAGNQRGWDAVAYWIWNSPALGVRYIIFDGAIWWPDSGWHVYEGPDPHRDHVHVSLSPTASPDLSRPPAPAPNLPYAPPSDPNPTPAPPTNPTPGDPAPTPTTPTWPDTGTSPDDPENCMASIWSWNPVDWVATPVRCTLISVFVPSPEVVTQVQADLTDKIGGTGVQVWWDVVGEIPPALDVGGDSGSCLGPGMDFPEPIGTVYVLDACGGIRATLAAACKTLVSASLIVGVTMSCLTFISRALGYDTELGKSTQGLRG